MQTLKMLEAAWEPSPPWKLSGSAFLVSGHDVESFLEIKRQRGGTFGQGFFCLCQNCGSSNNSYSGRAAGAVD